MIRIYNTETKWLGREREDNESIRILEGEIKLQVIRADAPPINPDTQRPQRLHPVIDTEAKTYTESWEVIDLTDYEIAMRDWDCPECSLRVVADTDLVLTEFGIAMKAWCELNEIPIVKKGDKVHIYCNEIREKFRPAVDAYIAEGKITIENIPKM